MSSYAMIPARHGSKRLPLKNLALINGRPLLSYAISAALDSSSFDRVIVNGDHEVFRSVAEEFGAEFYLRPSELGSDFTRSDDVVANFLQTYSEASTLAWVNPIAPLQSGDEIAKVMAFFFEQGFDSLITTQNRQVHARYQLLPLNFDTHSPFERTQDLVPVELFVYSMMVWNSSAFKQSFESTNAGIFCGSFGTHPASNNASIIVKTQEDLQLIERIVERDGARESSVKYDLRAHSILGAKP